MIDYLEEIALQELYEQMQGIIARLPTSRWFLFGSITSAKRPIADVDLLVVCETVTDCTTIRTELASVCARFPIHLLLMTASEEAEAKFVRGERAVEIAGQDLLGRHGPT